MQKLQLLGSAGKYDICSGCARTYDSRIYQAKTQSGCVPILKTLMTNECSLDCKYCANPISKSRASLEPEELARVFFGLLKQRMVQGLFLSSAVSKDPDFSMEKIIECAGIVRMKYGFSGYIHLKVLPGASRESVKKAAELADRLSINLEAPSSGIMSEIAPSKDYAIDLLRRQDWIAEENRGGMLKSGHTTQFIVGAAGESDADILHSLVSSYERTGVRRGYFSAFQPVPGTALEQVPAASKNREFRLYQSDWLLRVYGFDLSSFGSVFNGNGFLPNEDPKIILAREFLEPVDPSSAPYSELLKVPGIGPKAARNIIAERQKGKIDKKRLAGSGVILKRALPFLEINGVSQARLSQWA